MFSNQRKTIGVFIENGDNEFQQEVCNGITQEAYGLGYNVAVFSSFGSYDQGARYYRGNMQIYELPDYESLSGVILILDTIDDLEKRQYMIDTVKERCKCPVVSIRYPVEEFHTLLVDNREGMENMVRHFIEDHGFRRICFMTGPATNRDAIERLDCFRRVMAEHDLPVGEDQIFYGDFWKDRGRDACDHFFANGTPEAIICANDHMAIAVVSELIQRGVRVPGDVCVSGYDGIRMADNFTPSITTMVVRSIDMGTTAVRVIHEGQGKSYQPGFTYIPTAAKLQGSCGCSDETAADLVFSRCNQIEGMEEEVVRAIRVSFLSIAMEEAHTVEDMGDKIPKFTDCIAELKDYAICLNQDFPGGRETHGFSDVMEMRYAIKNGEPMNPLLVPFPRERLLPVLMTDDRPQVWYFAPLHYLERVFGYEAMSFQPPSRTGVCSFQMNVALGNKLQDIVLYEKMQKMIDTLENISIRDPLTGLYNRRGFAQAGGELFEHARLEGRPVFQAVIDMDGLKIINDNYSHLEGDFSIKKVGAVIQSRCNENYICARTGGDEFFLICTGITEEEGKALLAGIDAALEEFNKTGIKKYAIHVSHGYCYRVPEEDESMERFISVSDERMYQNKVRNKAMRGEPMR